MRLGALPRRAGRRRDGMKRTASTTPAAAAPRTRRERNVHAVHERARVPPRARRRTPAAGRRDSLGETLSRRASATCDGQAGDSPESAPVAGIDHGAEDRAPNAPPTMRSAWIRPEPDARVLRREGRMCASCRRQRPLPEEAAAATRSHIAAPAAAARRGEPAEREPHPSSAKPEGDRDCWRRGATRSRVAAHGADEEGGDQRQLPQAVTEGVDAEDFLEVQRGRRTSRPSWRTRRAWPARSPR